MASVGEVITLPQHLQSGGKDEVQALDDGESEEEKEIPAVVEQPVDELAKKRANLVKVMDICGS